MNDPELLAWREQFARDGFIIVRNFAPAALRSSMLEVIQSSLSPPLGPLEYEAEVNYPGAPPDIDADGGRTPRRLLNAFSRDAVFRQWASSPQVLERVRALLGIDAIKLSQNHHNCVMTKLPGRSSETGWHQDIRYWSFDRPELVNVWLALGDETVANGGLQLLPGTHLLDIERGRLDAALFLRTELAENATLLDSAVSAALHAGDVLFFHCRTFHSAGHNTTDAGKFSVVFSYRAADNLPIPQTRSARLLDVSVG